MTPGVGVAVGDLFKAFVLFSLAPAPPPNKVDLFGANDFIVIVAFDVVVVSFVAVFMAAEFCC